MKEDYFKKKEQKKTLPSSRNTDVKLSNFI